MASCTEEAMDLYRQSIYEALDERIKGEIGVILDPIRDTIHIYVSRKGLRYDWYRTKVSDLIVLGIPAEVVAAEFTDGYYDWIRKKFFMPDGYNTTKVWNSHLAILRGEKVG